MYHTLCILLASPAVYPIAIQSELPEPGHEGEDSSREGGQQVGVEIPVVRIRVWLLCGCSLYLQYF